MTTEHTPTPWELAAAPKQGQLKQDILSAEGRSLFRTIYDLPMEEQLANAEFVCRAVNSFDAMKAACESTLAYIENHFGMTPEGQAQRNAARDQLRAALALAERGEK